MSKKKLTNKRKKQLLALFAITSLTINVVITPINVFAENVGNAVNTDEQTDLKIVENKAERRERESTTTLEKNEELIINKLKTLKQTEVTEQIVTLINETNFTDLISVFSTSLYEDIPTNDTFQGQMYEITDLEETYQNKIKSNSAEFAKLIVNTNGYESYEPKDVKRQLVYLSYLMRWGSFSDGKRVFWHELYSNESTFLDIEEVKVLNKTFIDLFDENPEKKLASKEVTTTFSDAYKAADLSISNYKIGIEKFLTQAGITDYSEWFYEVFSGKVYKDHYEGSTYDVGIWNRSSTLTNFLPYLLNQKTDSNLMIGETRGEIVFTSPYNYGNDFVQAEKVLANAMKTITNTLELYDRTIVETDEMDVDKVLGQRAVLDQGRQWLNPEDSLSYELYRVAGYTGSHPNNGAVAGAGRIQMQANKLNAYATVAHELGHELDSLFSANSEFYTTYIDNPTRQQASYLNTFADGTSVVKQNNAISNTSVEKFQTKDDLTNYVTNMEDMAYLLDGIVATKVLALPVEEQVNYIKIAYVDGINGSLNTEIDNADTIQVRDLTLEELKTLNLQTIEDLIDHNAVIMQPSDSNLNILRNKGQGYGTTMTYSAFFLSNGKPYHHNHRIINTLLAENGWEAFKTFNVTYNSAYSAKTNNELSTDERVGDASLQALRAAFNDETVTYRSLMKQRYSEVMLRFKEGGLLDRSYQEMMDSMSTMDLANFYTFKQKNMSYYLNLSDEFSRSAIGYDKQIFVSVGSYTELYEAIKKNSSAQIRLTQSFKVEGQYAYEELPAFSGSLNGSGYTISKLNQALFSSITEAEVKNLVLRDIKIDEKIATNEGQNSYSGGLANTAQNSRIQNVHVVDASIFSTAAEKPIVGGMIGNSLNTVIQNSTVQDTVVSGAYVGGIAGRSENSKMLNVYTTGQLKGIPISDLRIGGIIGNGFTNTVVQNSYTTMEIEKGNGMLGSDYTGGNKNITFENSISLATILTTTKYKFYDYDVSTIWKNNYEVEEKSGVSSVSKESLSVSAVSMSQLDEKFFMEKMNWGTENIWEVPAEGAEKELPYLTNDDPRNDSRANQSILKLHTERKEITVGDSIDLTSLIAEVRDKDGKLVDVDEVTIEGDVNVEKVGEYLITYRFLDLEAQATIVVREPTSSEPTFEVDDYYIGDYNITGRFSAPIVTAQLRINGSISNKGGTFNPSDGTFYYYAGAGRIQTGQEVVLEGLDQSGNIVETVKIEPKVVEGMLSDVQHTIGSSTITGTYTGEMSKARLVVNGNIISVGGTFKDGTFSYYVAPNQVKETDTVHLQGYDKEGNPVGDLTPVTIQKQQGQLTEASYKLGQSMITGTYEGNVKKARLLIDGKQISWGGTFKEGTFSYYVAPGTIKANSTVELAVYGEGDILLAENFPVLIQP
ncbi:immunoglobulin-like domain-containing protein [Enterococcus faecalis]|uniref:immunoglobulin-like domain-containing protein n=1 Tax=Enterococcus faecalis TaxID=1351 RepID=UPI0035EB2989